MTDIPPASPEESSHPHPPTTHQSGGVNLGAYNRFERIDTLIGGDQVAGDKVQNKFEIGTLNIITYTGPAQPPDEAARHALERAYCSEVAARYALWRTRYTTLPIQVAGQAYQTTVLPYYEREELVFAALRNTFATDASGTPTGDQARSHEATPPQIFTDLRDGLAHYNDLLLLGPPGGGKTTALWRLALDLAEAGMYSERATQLPIFVRLGGVKDGQSLGDLLQMELAGTSLEDSSGRRFPLQAHRKLAPLVPDLLDSGRFVLLWDGLNEVPQKQFQTIAAALASFRREHPGPLSGPRTQSITTCRADDYTLLTEQYGGKDPLMIQHAVIQGLDSQTIAQLIRARFGATSGQVLLDALDQPQHQALAGLARTPLLLTMLCEVYAATGTLPSNRGTLLKAFVAQRWEWERPRHPQRWIREDNQERAFASLAYAITASRGRGTSVQWEWAAHQLRTNFGSPNPERLRALGQRADLLEMLDDGRAVRFSHQLVQEYFAAVALRARLASAVHQRQRWLTRRYGQRKLRQYAAPGQRTGWEETLLLLAGLEGESGIAHELIRLFLNQPLQSARLLLVSGEGNDPALIEEVRVSLVGALDDPRLSVRERVEAGTLLGQFGDPRLGVCTLEPEWCDVPAGRFLLGSTNQDTNASDSEKPQHEITLPAFQISRYPVTNAQYALFMDDSGYGPTQPWWDTAGRAWLARADTATPDWQSSQRRKHKDRPEYWDDNRFGIARSNCPVVGVSWYEAAAYCRWLSQQLGYEVRLPSDAEWEKAARGTDGRIYPWGNLWNSAKTNGAVSDIGETSPVGCFPDGASPYGMLDMVGNVWEWTRSVFKPYPYNPVDGREETDEPARKYFTLRGGSWADVTILMRASYRYGNTPENQNINIGFRLTRP